MKTSKGQPSDLAIKLKEARIAADLSTRQVSKLLSDRFSYSLSHASVASYERGASSPDGRLLAHLAAIYSRNVEWFLEPGGLLSVPRFREAASLVRAGDRAAYLAQATHVLRCYRRLEQTLGNSLRADVLGFQAGPNDSGRDLAEMVRRKHLKLGDDDPVSSVIEVMECTYGVRVIEQPTPSRIDGFAATMDGEHVVVLNPSVPNDRNRLNAGHELGHVLFIDCENKELLPKKEVESRAYEFGFHLLMPVDRLREAVSGKSMVKLVKFKERYGVSLSAMIYRAGKLKYLSEDETARLWRQFAIRGWRRNEPGTVRADRATRFERLFEEAASEGSFVRQSLLKTMGMQADEMQRRCDLAAGFLPPHESVDNEDEKGEGEADVLKFPQ